ncbi:hypothetical protein V2W45_1473870 [Cenococcum geophilum]
MRTIIYPLQILVSVFSKSIHASLYKSMLTFSSACSQWYVDVCIVIRLASDFDLKNEAIYGTAAAVVVTSYLPHQHPPSDPQILRKKALDGPVIEDIFQTAALRPDFLLRSEPAIDCLSLTALVSSQPSGLAILAKMAPAPARRYPFALAPGAFASMKSLSHPAALAVIALPRCGSRSTSRHRSVYRLLGAVHADRKTRRGPGKRRRCPSVAHPLSRSSGWVRRAGCVGLVVERGPDVSCVRNGCLWVLGLRGC